MGGCAGKVRFLKLTNLESASVCFLEVNNFSCSLCRHVMKRKKNLISKVEMCIL